jgi:hypothetical protein
MNENAKITENKPDVPYIVFEGEMARAERYIKRLWIALIIAIICVLASNVAWLLYISQYDFESYEVVAEGDGHANYIGQDGDIYNGESISETAQKEKSLDRQRQSNTP